MVLWLGEFGQGAQRWLNLGIRFQPSEIMKLSVPMMIAWYLHEKRLPPTGKELIVIMVLVIIPGLLIAIQPDLGTSLLVITAGLIVVFLSGIPFRYIFSLIILCIPSSLLLWKFMKEYQRQRVLTLINPDTDPLGAGYQIIQSKIAVGSGGLFGKGFLKGTQSYLEFLPEKHTDFIFTLFSEEFGFFGSLFILLLYALIISRIIRIGNLTRSNFGKLYCYSFATAFFIYVAVNMMMVLGLLPSKYFDAMFLTYSSSTDF